MDFSFSKGEELRRWAVKEAIMAHGDSRACKNHGSTIICRQCPECVLIVIKISRGMEILYE